MVQNAQGQVYQLKITLHPTRPPIWRRILVSADATLADLHRVIQSVMNWQDYHMHAFYIGDVEYGPPPRGPLWPGEEAPRNEGKVRLGDLGLEPRRKFSYVYDFGDDWEHVIQVEAVLPLEPTLAYPICTAGRRAAPPEDVGGVWGFYELLDVAFDPAGGVPSEEAMEVLGEGFDLARFDRDVANERLRRAFVPARRGRGARGALARK